MNAYIFIWIIGAMFSFGISCDGKHEPPFGLFVQAIMSFIVWPMMLGSEIRRAINAIEKST